MIPESDLEIGQFRLLDVDNKMIIPVDTHIRLIVTANDVLHSFAVPSLGLKLDCTPGRLNQASFLVDRTGTFYGQCSEICLRPGRIIDYENEKILLMFSTSYLTVIYDVILLKLRSRLANFFHIRRKNSVAYERKVFLSHVKNLIQTRQLNENLLFPFNSFDVKFKPFEGPLTCYRYHGGKPLNPLGLQVLNMSEQWGMIISSNKNITCGVTGIKNISFVSINNSKLGNPVFLDYKTDPGSLWNTDISVYSNKRLEESNFFLSTQRGQDGHQAIAKRSSNLQNWPAYNIGNKFYRLKLPSTFSGTEIRSFSTKSSQKESNLVISTQPSINDKKLTLEIKKQFDKGEWLNPEQKQDLNKFIEKSQNYLTEISIKDGMNSSKIKWLFEKYIHSLLFQTYVIETLSQNRGSKTTGIDGIILKNTFDNKYELLTKLKKFRTNKIQPLKRIYIPKNLTEKRPLSIPSILDRATQLLVFSILDPIIEPHSDLFSFGFRKGRSPILAIATLQKNLQSKPDLKTKSIDTQYIWDADIRKCFDRINHDWLLKNVPIPGKYSFLLKGWLKAGYLEFQNPDLFPTDEGIPQGGIISPLLMNFTLNGLENLLEEAKKEYVNTTKGACLSYREVDGWRIRLKAVSRLKTDEVFKERSIACKIIRFADDFILISGSERLLNIIKVKAKNFLKIRGLEIHPDKTRTIKLGINTSFNFLGYTFTFLMRTKHIRNKFLHHKKPEYRLKGIPRLFVYPSTDKFNKLKVKLIDIFRSTYNLTAFELISSLNPMITGWVNYFSYGNAGGILSSFKKFLYNRIKIWIIKKHPKSSIRWLIRHYLLLNTNNLLHHHNLDQTSVEQLELKLLNHESARTNKWNFYGLAFKDENKQDYKIPKLNILKWPTNIKNILVPTVFAPSRELLKTSVYNNKQAWLNLSLKMSALHDNKKESLVEDLWKRDHGLCYFCKSNISLEESNQLVVHHIQEWAKTKSNKKANLCLAHESCHIDWHNSSTNSRDFFSNYSLKPNTKGELKYSKNRKELKNSK